MGCSVSCQPQRPASAQRALGERHHSEMVFNTQQVLSGLIEVQAAILVPCGGSSSEQGGPSSGCGDIPWPHTDSDTAPRTKVCATSRGLDVTRLTVVQSKTPTASLVRVDT
ncbi:hypothetical protein ACOMHN_025099 [Nucella lapillus]